MAVAYKRNYRFYLQKRFDSRQACLSFHDDGTVTLTTVPSLPDIRAKDVAKKDTPAQTLAYFDALTTEHEDLYSFLHSIETEHPDLGYFSNNFKLVKTHIGYFYGSKLRRMVPAFDDENLRSVALNAEGSEVGKNDTFAYNYMNFVISRIADPNDSDYVKSLVDTAKKNDGFRGGYEYSITDDVVNIVSALHNAAVNYPMCPSIELWEDISAWKADLKQKMQQYKVFREIYRFTKAYDLVHATEKTQPVIETPVTPKTVVVEDKPKQKSIGTCQQLTIFDIFPDNN